MKQTLVTLLSAYGATGQENTVRGVLSEMIRPYVDTMKVDALGNLIATKKGTGGGKRVMLCGHMDHIGLIVTDIDEKGFLRVHNVGGIGGNTIIANHVVFENGTNGLIYFEVERENKADLIPLSQMYIDIGASSKEDAMKRVSIGDVAVFAPDVFDLGEHRVSGPAMDDRCACAIIVETLRALQDCPNEVIAVFSTQEEVGLRGARAAAYSVNPDFGIALDITASGDTPKSARMAVSLGCGPAIKVMDASVICHPGLRDHLVAVAKRENIPYQMEVLPFGGTDTAAIQLTRGGIPAVCISVPGRYIHSACETVDIRDMENGVALLVATLSGDMPKG